MPDEKHNHKATSKIAKLCISMARKWLANNIISLIVAVVAVVVFGVGLINWKSDVNHELKSINDKITIMQKELKASKIKMYDAMESGPKHHMTREEFNLAMERLRLLER